MTISKSLKAAGIAVFAAMLGAAGAVAQDKTKVGFVYVGPIGDHGWTYQHHKGLEAVEAEFGDKVETTYVENVSEGPDAERVIQQLAQQGNDIIFTTSFGFMNPTIKVAKRFPDVKFEHATGFKKADNVSIYNTRFYQGRYIVGQIAGKMTKTNTIGYIASFPIPEVVMGINATYLGAKSVNPDIKIKVIWVSTWFDPGKEADAAKALVDQGSDILMQHTDSPAAIQLAEQEGIYAIGQASDMKTFGPNAQLTSLIDDWAPYYVERVKAVIDGTWETSDIWGGLANGMLKMAPYSDKLPEDVIALAKEMEEKIKSGEFHPFTGPLNKQDGTQFLADGEVISDEVLLGMNFYVEGIEGSLPK
ncbi:MAG: BMP family ABC transporter substrate-binding protein [Hyphomicrobiales bacterium]|nr:BMP family ABC transporter substrate-binding protein [Hyphomicrobiales bacterium]